MRFACVSYIPFFRHMRRNSPSMRLIISLLITFPFIALAQLPVGQAPEYKRVILEEFTAYRCGFCPSGHELANDIETALGDNNVIQVGYHSGSLAMPFHRLNLTLEQQMVMPFTHSLVSLAPLQQL